MPIKTAASLVSCPGIAVNDLPDSPVAPLSRNDKGGLCYRKKKGVP